MTLQRRVPLAKQHNQGLGCGVVKFRGNSNDKRALTTVPSPGEDVDPWLMLELACRIEITDDARWQDKADGRALLSGWLGRPVRGGHGA